LNAPMFGASIRLTLRHHRFEVLAAVIAAAVLGVLAIVVKSRLDGVGVPAGCFEAWLTSGPDASKCSTSVQEFARINEDEAGKLFAAMAVLPLAGGVVAGVSLVAKELESRTAQTAWSLAPSRAEWLALQLLPVVVVVGAAMSFAAVAAGALEATRLAWLPATFNDLTMHGAPIVARAVGAIAIGLFVGSLMGRQLPALIVASVVLLVVTTQASAIEAQWLRSQQEVVAGGGEFPAATVDGTMFEPAWQGPYGEIARVGEPIDGIPAPNPGAGATTPSASWRAVTIGVPASRAPGMAALDVALFLLVGLVASAGSFVIVDRRRPV